jgi:hypothetical protein
VNASPRYITATELREALPKLKSLNPFFGTCYLAFKRHALPVGGTTAVVFARLNRAFLEEHYRPVQWFEGFYHPFQSGNAGSGWVNAEYARTSLQRIAKNTFNDALLHPSNTQWGWKPNYVARLKAHLSRGKIPAFELATWLYRDRSWHSRTSPDDLVSELLSEYEITELERTELFDTAVPARSAEWLGSSQLLESELVEVIGDPPGRYDERVSSLMSLTLHNVGPAEQLRYEPAERLNILTGDNSLGKTFLFECAWWALTGEWIDRHAMPLSGAARKGSVRIEYELATGAIGRVKHSAKYNWDRQEWPTKDRDTHPGLAIYARYDGSFAIWDPVRTTTHPETKARLRGVVLSRDEVWQGKISSVSRQDWICNGLIRDWVSWQTGDRFRKHWSALEGCLAHLSPSSDETLQPDEPVRYPGDSREIPTVRLPYGSVPVLHASAGVQRALAMAYVLVWAWHEHQAFSALAQRPPQQRIAFLIDEVEAHLHPRWQRTIVPAIERAVAHLSNDAMIQLHVATHSPMVLASAEVIFDEDRDTLHHLQLADGHVVLKQFPFVRLGRVDRWLTSPVFGLVQARSREAEAAITRAVHLQKSENPAKDEVRTVHHELVRLLANDDGFWPRWRFFALSRGVDE